MGKRRMTLYSTIFFICFFLTVSFCLSTHTIEYAHEIQTNTLENQTDLSDESIEVSMLNDSEYSAFYTNIEQLLKKSSESFSGDVGITYVDLTTGKVLSVNGSKEFYSASTIKVPLAMMIADKIDSGELRWEDEFAYNETTDYEEGTGIIINNIQTSYSLKTLQEYNIVYSDNIAKNMLYDLFGGSVPAKQALYAQFLQKDTDWNDAKFTSEDAAKILTTLYEEKMINTNYESIYNYMKQTVFHERMETSLTTGKVAHKIGSYEGNLHDIGIFETDYPFILTVFTNSQTDDGAALISSITDQVWTIQQQNYPTTK